MRLLTIRTPKMQMQRPTFSFIRKYIIYKRYYKKYFLLRVVESLESPTFRTELLVGSLHRRKRDSWRDYLGVGEKLWIEIYEQTISKYFWSNKLISFDFPFPRNATGTHADNPKREPGKIRPQRSRFCIFHTSSNRLFSCLLLRINNQVVPSKISLIPLSKYTILIATISVSCTTNQSQQWFEEVRFDLNNSSKHISLQFIQTYKHTQTIDFNR